MLKLRILLRFALVWSRHPSWRFTQVVVNVADMNDPFYLEDDQFLQNLREW